MMEALETYRSGVNPARQLLVGDAVIQRMMDPTLPPSVFHRFLIEFSARAVQITEPVEGWIRRAGERTLAVGFSDVGESLVMHSKHEAGHHLMLIDDTRHLVAVWNREHPGDLLDAEVLLAEPSTPSIREYIRLHEETIAGEMPYAQVAIELEIESMSISVGPKLLEQCKRMLSEDAFKGLSFVTEHVELDVGHSALNAVMLKKLLDRNPEAAEALGRVGQRAITAYLGFFQECLALAGAWNSRQARA